MANPVTQANSETVCFWLNGEQIKIESPPPELLLIDFLRSPDIGLSGPKKPCGQGGCGGCTVVLSHWDASENKAVHRSINSCLRPVAALNGLSVTTVEGTGSTKGKMNPVAYYLALNNGSQCGYCSAGFVMNMTGYLANDPKSRTKSHIEKLFDGNICRCTGFRPILEGMKSFATDWSEEDEKARMKCELDLQSTFTKQRFAKPKDLTVTIPFPDAAKASVPPVSYQTAGKSWTEVSTLPALTAAWKAAEGKGQKVRFVNGNTSHGIYPDECEGASVYIDIRNVPDLQVLTKTSTKLTIGAGVTYGDLAEALQSVPLDDGSTLGAIRYMVDRTAGRMVRNAGTVGGNLMLALQHIHEGAPFPSDLLTVLCGVATEVTFIKIGAAIKTTALGDLLDDIRNKAVLAKDVLIVQLEIKLVDDVVHLAQKVALREVNSHTIVNSASVIKFTSKGASTLSYVGFIVGGIDTAPVSLTSATKMLQGVALTPELIKKSLQAARASVETTLAATQARRAGLPDEGFTDAYRADLAVNQYYKALVNALSGIPGLFPAKDESAGEQKWGKWPISFGTQNYDDFPDDAPLGVPYVTLNAMRQAQGEIRYGHEIRPARNTLFGAVVPADRITGGWTFKVKEKPSTQAQLAHHLRTTIPGFADLVTAADIPAGGSNNMGMGADQPLFVPMASPTTSKSAKKANASASGSEAIMYVGQALALVLASDPMQAEAIAALIARDHIDYKPQVAGKNPVLTLQAARDGKLFFPDWPNSAPWMSHVWKVVRPRSDLKWMSDLSKGISKPSIGKAQVGGKTCAVVTTQQSTGGQLHFYMETQAATADLVDVDKIEVTASTQSPATVLRALTSVLNLRGNQISVQTPQLGGAYGGKTEPSQLVAAMAALATLKTGLPTQVTFKRETDSALIGQNHPFLGTMELAVDEDGNFQGLNGDILMDGGAYYDCSFVVSDCVQLRMDSAYHVPNYQTAIDVYQTNTAPNTAFRAFGDMQGTMILENAIEDAAVALNMDPAVLREKNLYREGDVTPSGQVLADCYMTDVWKEARTYSNYDKRKAEIDEYNSKNRWRKRGICLLPMKYGSGYNLALLEQTTAIVNIYPEDGTILAIQGGVDMGQGMTTKLAQIVAKSFKVPVKLVRIQAADTRTVPNPSSTGASTGTAYNGLALQNACEILKQTLAATTDPGKYLPWTSKAKFDSTKWKEFIGSCAVNRVNLQAQAQAKVPGGGDDMYALGGLFFKTAAQSKQSKTGILSESTIQQETVNNYIGFTYNAACVEVEVDILTGETKVLRADIVYDTGVSLNPAVDIGQIEGAFLQGLGYVLCENIVRESSGPNAGRLNTVNTWTYKPPAAPTIPLEMNVRLHDRGNGKQDLQTYRTDPLASSKEVGEPPLVLANAAFFAVKSAVRAARVEAGLAPDFFMNAPATVQTVQQLCPKPDQAKAAR